MATNHPTKITHAARSTGQIYRAASMKSQAPKTAITMNKDVRSQGSQISVAADGLWMAMTPTRLLALK